MRTLLSIGAITALAAAHAGCDNNHLIGSYDGGGGSGGAASPDGGGNTTGTQSWSGYVENYQFPSGSDAIRISFTSMSAGPLVGTVKLGNGTPPPAATDPNVGYPPALAGEAFFTDGPDNYVAEGFVYPMLDGTLTGGRLRFGVGLWELWRGWCALQTPIAGSSDCLPPNGGSMFSLATNECTLRVQGTEQYTPVDCGKLILCTGMLCRCDLAASACSVVDAGAQLSFDVSVDATRADGSVSGKLGDHNVHFTKDL